MLLIPCAASLHIPTKAEPGQGTEWSDLIVAYEASHGNPFEVSLMYAASKADSPLSQPASGAPAPGCAPTIVIAGMARTGTSHMRNFLGTFEETHVGRDVEDWSLALSSMQKARKHWASNFECGEIPSARRVAAFPWLFSSHERLANAARNAPDVTYVLILRDPVERFVSSYYHLDAKQRALDLPRLTRWASEAHRSQHFAFEDLHEAVGRRSQWPEPYYTMDMEGCLQRVMQYAKGDRLLVGLTEELEPLKDKLVSRFNLSSRPPGAALGHPLLKSANNLASRETLMLPEEVISAAVQVARAKTDFARVAELLSNAGTPTTVAHLRCLWRHTSGESCGS